ncbi:hypothetical protein AV530_001485 [Patagioenas fasciata monilis]|uniref:E3 ubiquitin-protein ligase Topors n=1 Tax=Patagioenas fasciata monilis TaxID=372326 RepID=A0A1V4KK31_PATFA|nr:hypothetical protein AV530_001485 [Patagioenas fasciata monilis]
MLSTSEEMGDGVGSGVVETPDACAGAAALPCRASWLSVPKPRAAIGYCPTLPGSGSRGTQEACSQQQSVTPTAAAPVRGSNSTSPAPCSPLQLVESMAMEMDNICPVCLDSWEEASYVTPCLHRFCYPCILQWAESKPECPLCKRRILSIVHSVRADDDFEEHVITPPAPLLSWARQELGLIFRSRSSRADLVEELLTSLLVLFGLDEDLLVQLLAATLENHAATGGARARVWHLFLPPGLCKIQDLKKWHWQQLIHSRTLYQGLSTFPW